MARIKKKVSKSKSNRVGGTGLFPVPTSHTTVRTVRYTAVLYLRCNLSYTSEKNMYPAIRNLSLVIEQAKTGLLAVCQ